MMPVGAVEVNGWALLKRFLRTVWVNQKNRFFAGRL